MSAGVSRDPLVVNTQDGCCWVRRAWSRDGRGLYALEGTSQGAPDMVLASLRELAELGLASMADALPMPVGAEPEGEHYAAVHHDYRIPHDLPEPGGAR